MMAILEKETVFTDDIRPVPASELEELLTLAKIGRGLFFACVKSSSIIHFV